MMNQRPNAPSPSSCPFQCLMNQTWIRSLSESFTQPPWLRMRPWYVLGLGGCWVAVSV